MASEADRLDNTGPDGVLDDTAASWLEEQLAVLDTVPSAAPEASPPQESGDHAPDPALVALFELAERRNATDVHLAVGRAAHLRSDGRMQAIRELDDLRAPQVEAMLESLLTDRGRRELGERGSCDTVVTLRSGRRVRGNIFRGDVGLTGAFRLLEDRLPTLEQLGVPTPLADLARSPRGLLLVTGATGSGKTTTIAALIEQVIGQSPLHILTLEDPIEYRFPTDGPALVTQRQVGTHAVDFPNALRQAMRQDPDVIVIGEMRDTETISAALTAAETGHLVLATLHSRTAQGAVSRVVESFAGDRQNFVRDQLANALVGVASQQLVPTERGGRVLASELLVATSGIANLIREGKLHQIGAAIDTGAARGMQSMDRSLAGLARRGVISRETALARCVDPAGVEEHLR